MSSMLNTPSHPASPIRFEQFSSNHATIRPTVGKKDMNGSKRSWKVYPPTYRAREVKQIADWIRAGESGSLIGLAGAGKSNLLGFLCQQPEVVAEQLGVETSQVALIHVDLNNLPVYDLATFFRVILRSLHEIRQTLNDRFHAPIETLYRKVEDKTDPFLSQSAIRELLLLFREYNTRLVLILDPFDYFCQKAPTLVLDNLRGLRDSFKTTLSYIIGLRRQVSYLRDPLELGELYEIIDTHQCWLGAMESDDARWVIGQVESATGQAFDQETIDQLIELTGGYPALLKPASFWRVKASPLPPVKEWKHHLVSEPSIANRLYDIRIGLTGEEESALSVLEAALNEKSVDNRRKALRQIEEKYGATLDKLAAKRLCEPTKKGWQLFSPLFALFVSQMEGVSAGRIWYDRRTGRFWQGERELHSLSSRDNDLLRHFLTYPLSAHSVDDLIEAAWQEDYNEGVSREAVQQAIRHLRKQIEPNPAKPCYLVTEHKVGYRFFPEGAPRG